MADGVGLDWPAYLRGLQEQETRALAVWLAAEGLAVGEFMEVVDRTYAAAPAESRAPPRLFVTQVGQPAAAAYARRKRHGAGLLAALDEALGSGALPGSVTLYDLRPCPPPGTPRLQAEALLARLERARADRR